MSQSQSTADRFSPRRDAAEDSIDDLRRESAFFKRGCCCFWNFPCFGKSDIWERIDTTSDDRRQQREEEDGRRDSLRVWWGKGLEALKKAREWSELVAGPKWKTFIRRFNRTGAGRSRAGKFQYDPMSYALNFDEGQGQNGNLEDDRVLRDFSSRYAAIPVFLHSGQLS